AACPRIFGAPTVVAERIVALADRLAEAQLAGPGDEVQPFLGMPRDAVEQSAEGAARREPHVLCGLVAEELQHHELIRRGPSPAVRESERVLVEPLVGDALQAEA